MNLTPFTTVRIARDHVEHTEAALRDAGADGHEIFVLWTGSPADPSTFDVQAVHVPRQKSYRTRDGLLVRVEGPELHRLNAWLYEHKQTLLAQIHAHPDDAYHSDTDDAYPIVTTEGGLSIVVPDFCRDGLFAYDTAVYRLATEGWVEDDDVRVEVR